jgi:hypothetical protein
VNLALYREFPASSNEVQGELLESKFRIYWAVRLTEYSFIKLKKTLAVDELGIEKKGEEDEVG